MAVIKYFVFIAFLCLGINGIAQKGSNEISFAEGFRDSIRTSMYARDLTSELILGVGYKFCPYSENLYNSGSYCMIEYQYRQPVLWNNVRFGFQSTFKMLGLFPRQTRFNKDFVEDLYTNQTDLSRKDSIYQRAFYRALNYAPDSTRGQLFGSILLTSNFLKIANGTLKLGLGMSSVTAVTRINSYFINKYDPEPIDLTISSSRNYTAQLAYIINYRKHQYYFDDKFYYRLGLSCQYTDLRRMTFGEMDITKFTTLSSEALWKHGLAFNITLELLLPIDLR
jgi:hypothetical protein